MKKLIFLALVILSLFPIYVNSISHKINYVSLGDSLAAGRNPYKQVGFGYSDYVKNYLKKNDLLEFYTKGFAVSGYKIKDLKLDIENNVKIQTPKKKITIQHALKDADIVTLSIGANDVFNELGLNDLSFNFEKLNEAYEIVDNIAKELEELIKLIKKYTDKDIILLGYYNPLTNLSEMYDTKLEPLFIYLNNKYRNIALENDVHFVDVYKGFRRNGVRYLPNPADIHPSNEGYRYIADKIIDIIEEKIIK